MLLVCELTLTILPWRRSIIPGARAWASRKGARRLTAWTRSQCSTLHSRMLSTTAMPALLTRMSIPPQASTAAPAAARGPAMVAMSAVITRQRRPHASTPALASASPAASRATTATSAPASANTRQISRPMPLEAPVTSARLPVSEKRSTNDPAIWPPLFSVAGVGRLSPRRAPPSRGGSGAFAATRPRQQPRQVLAGVAATCGGDLLGRAFGHRPAPTRAAFRPHVDQPVRRLDHLEIVLDDDHRVARVDQRVQHLQQLPDVLEMQAGGRLVQDVDGLARGAPAQFLGELDPLRLPARQRGRLLADMDVAQAHLLQGHQLVVDRRHRLEEIDRLVDGHVEHVGDRPRPVGHFQRLAVEALAAADVAGDEHVRQEMHLDLDQAVALAGLAAAALDVEAEPARPVAARLGFREPREPVPDGREGAGVGGWVGARRAADWRLVDVDHLVDMLDAGEAVVLAGDGARSHQPLGQDRVERVDDEAGLARARHPGDAHEAAQREAGVDVEQVVGAAAGQLQPAVLRGLAPLGRDRDGADAGKVLASERGW